MKRLKAEWENQEAILLALPHANTDWQPYLKEARETFLEIIKAILPHQKVLLCVDNEDSEGLEFVQNHLDGAQNLTIARHPLNDTWARDFGPISIEENGGVKMLDFGFNGWGLKYPSNFDNQISRRLFADKILSNLHTKDLILEGGSIDSDGEGTLLTTAQCLLEANRNPTLTKEMLESRLKLELGAQRILWLHAGYLAGDDTDSHVDTLARFLNPSTIAYIACEDREDEHYEALARMQEELKSFRTKEGKPYNLIPLPLPCIYHDGERLPASYANFLLINGGKLLLPTYNTPELDSLAIARLSPYYEVVPIDCSTLIRQHGSLHCVSMQLYALS